MLEDNEHKDGCSEQEEEARFNARMGPFFTRALMKELLSLTDSEVDRLIAAQCLLAVITEDEVELFPAFQLDTDRNQVRAPICTCGRYSLLRSSTGGSLSTGLPRR